MEVAENMGKSRIDDCDKATTTGYYVVNSSLGLENAPNDRIWGNMAVFKSGDYLTQVIYSSGDSVTRIYSRMLISGTTWTPWIRLDNFGYNSLAELAAALKPLM